jgi:hypothetical protein
LAGSALWRPLPGPGGAQPVALGARLDDVGPEGEAVDHGGGQAGIGEGLAPLAEAGVGGQGDGGSFLSFGDDLEQQLGTPGVDADVADLVELSRARHRSAYADPGTMPTRGRLTG